MGFKEKIEGPLPVHLNLSSYPDQQDVIGWANIYRTSGGRIRIKLDFEPDAAIKFNSLYEIFQLKALGFAGILRPGASVPKPQWREALAPGISRTVPDVELLARITNHISDLESEVQRLKIKAGEIEPPKEH